MEPFATLTVDRGDRPQFFNFCRHQIDKLTIQPKHSIFIADPPSTIEPDITLRMRKGIVAARNLGIDIVYVMESDDNYPDDYIERMWIGQNDFIGCSKSLYYNLKNKTYQEFSHPKRSSLFCTAFRISALDRFLWPPDDTIFLDLYLWKYAHTKGMKAVLLDESIGVGIKHGIGKTAGAGHRMVMPNVDTNGAFLKLKVGQEAYAFYQTL